MQKEKKISKCKLLEPFLINSTKCINKNQNDSLSNFQEAASLKIINQAEKELFFSEGASSMEKDEAFNSPKSSEDTLATNLENLLICESAEKKLCKKKPTKNKALNLAVSLRYEKHGRKVKAKKLFQKISRVKQRYKNTKSPRKRKKALEKKVEIPKKGKRGQLGGKAKAKPPLQTNEQKYDSDEEVDYFYLNRISLGQFQKLRDDSGASTSNQPESIASRVNSLHLQEDNLNPTPEELELLELEEWGRSFYFTMNQLNSEK